jgi:predicted SprT family Zn-dependent metalloprotease
MELAEAAAVAQQLMDIHGLRGWRFKFDNAKRRFGCCNYRTQTISLSRYVTELNSRDDVIDTVLHDVAHALAGRSAGHGPAWKVRAETIGCRAERCSDTNTLLTPPKRFVGTCPSCGRVFRRHRRTRSACPVCCKTYNAGRFDDRFLLVWEMADSRSRQD